MLLFGNPTPELLLAVLIALGIGMTVHEFAHNYVGYLMGDPTPAREGRLTLNPFVHINWVGWLMFALIGFGILGSAPISPQRMRNPRWGFLAAVAAGPISNLLLAIVAAIPLRLINPQYISLTNATSFQGLIVLILAQIIFFNVILFFFNLIPLFPIDGWHIVHALLPAELAYTWQRYQQTTQWIFLGLLFLSFVHLPGFDPFSAVIFQPSISLFRVLTGH